MSELGVCGGEILETRVRLERPPVRPVFLFTILLACPPDRPAPHGRADVGAWGRTAPGTCVS